MYCLIIITILIIIYAESFEKNLQSKHNVKPMICNEFFFLCIYLFYRLLDNILNIFADI